MLSRYLPIWPTCMTTREGIEQKDDIVASSEIHKYPRRRAVTDKRAARALMALDRVDVRLGNRS